MHASFSCTFQSTPTKLGWVLNSSVGFSFFWWRQLWAFEFPTWVLGVWGVWLWSFQFQFLAVRVCHKDVFVCVCVCLCVWGGGGIAHLGDVTLGLTPDIPQTTQDIQLTLSRVHTPKTTTAESRGKLVKFYRKLLLIKVSRSFLDDLLKQFLGIWISCV